MAPSLAGGEPRRPRVAVAPAAIAARLQAPRPHRGGRAATPVLRVAAEATAPTWATIRAEPAGTAGEAIAGGEAARVLAALAHEMRTPLASMMATAGLLRDELGADGAARAAPALDRLQRGLLWMQHLVDNLAASPLAGGRVHLRLEPVRLAEAAEEAIELARPLLERRGQSASVAGDRRAVAVVDRARLRQVLLNLLVNAGKYSVEGDRVEVAVAAAGGWATVAVADHGPGIPARDRRRVLAPYARGGGAGGAERLGLGLSIVRELAEAHGGTVALRATPGGGATVAVSLPRCGPDGTPPTPLD